MKKPSPAEVRKAEFYPSVKDLGTPELTYRFEQNKRALSCTSIRIVEIQSVLRTARIEERILSEQHDVMAAVLTSRR